LEGDLTCGREGVPVVFGGLEAKNHGIGAISIRCHHEKATGPGRPWWELSESRAKPRFLPEHQPKGEPTNPPEGAHESHVHAPGWNPGSSGPGGCQMTDVTVLGAQELDEAIHASPLLVQILRGAR
jgi:hypothetical protein